jgi:energy-coupling factor transport system permease protein
MAIEFSRDITFGQYLDLGSPIHKLDPRAKIVATGALMFATLAARTFPALIPTVVILALVQVIGRIPLGYTLRGLRLLFATASFLFIFQVLFFPAPPDPIWRWGIISISWPGIVQGLITLARIILLYYLTTLLMFTTSLVDLADGTEVMMEPLKRLRVPVNELVMTMIVALKFVPLLVAELERLIKAQAARGDRFDQGGPIQRARKVGTLLVPLFVGALARAEVLTAAMNARCYRGGQGRTKRRVLTLRPIDVVAMLIAIIAAVAARLVG